MSRAIGWGPTDFLIAGGPSFTDRIGVFDQHLNFKGYLDVSTLTVGGMDFDSAGQVVAVVSVLREVRVYASTGQRVGGFVRDDDALGGGGDLKVAPGGSYVVGPKNQLGTTGAREFSSAGDFTRQFGAGNVSGLAVVPGNALWTAGLGSHAITKFDLVSGAELGSFPFPGSTTTLTMSYSALTNTVLTPDAGSSRVLELDLSGALIREFQAPSPASFSGVTRGPRGDVFATTGGSQSVLRWSASGGFLGTTSTATTLGSAGRILWAGNVPEAGSASALAVALMSSLTSRRRKGRRST